MIKISLNSASQHSKGNELSCWMVCCSSFHFAAQRAPFASDYLGRRYRSHKWCITHQSNGGHPTSLTGRTALIACCYFHSPDISCPSTPDISHEAGRKAGSRGQTGGVAEINRRILSFFGCIIHSRTENLRTPSSWSFTTDTRPTW